MVFETGTRGLASLWRGLRAPPEASPPLSVIGVALVRWARTRFDNQTVRSPPSGAKPKPAVPAGAAHDDADLRISVDARATLETPAQHIPALGPVGIGRQVAAPYVGARDSLIPDVAHIDVATQAGARMAAVPAEPGTEPRVEPKPARPAVLAPSKSVARPRTKVAAERRISLWLPALSLVAACGLAVVVAADTLARSGRSRPDYLFWLGLLLIVIPIAFRLLARNVARYERIALVLVVTLELYFVKVAWSPIEFTLADEFVHWFNVDQILSTKALFSHNPILSVTSRYPGIETATAGLVSVTGLSTVHAGLVIVGISKILLMLALFLLFEEITDSPRLAGLGALLYTANGNFLFFSATFKYESLALPLVVVSALGVEKWRRNPDYRTLWAAIALLAITCTIITHHISSYLLFGYLAAASVTHVLIKREIGRSPLPFALFSGAATVAWLIFVAGETRSYVRQIFGRAFTGFVETVSTRQGRAPLTNSEGVSAPAWEHLAAFGFVALLALALPIALWRVWRTYRTNVPVLVLSAAAIGYLGSFGLRLSPAAWETGNRASEFLFVGTALMLSLVALELTRRTSFSRGWVAVFGLATTLVFVGSNTGGQPNDLRLPLPLRVEADGHILAPQGYVVADWAAANLGSRAKIVADEANRRLLMVRGASGFDYGHGRTWGAQFLLQSDAVSALTLDVIRQYNLRYVVADRRKLSWDNSRGYYFTASSDEVRRFPPAYALKFERLRGTQRLVDTGDIVVFDLGARVAP
jgi:hypothetical protein